jgi:nucleoid DNA-binding protein
MTKLEVANLLRQRAGLTQRQALDMVELFLDSVKDALLDGKKVSLVGFGTFFLKKKPGRTGRNPRTGEVISIPEKYVVSFRPGREFRDQVERPDTSVSVSHPQPQAIAAISAKPPKG